MSLEKDMALVPCRECGQQVSTTAGACPNCGAKPKRIKWWLWGPLGLVALFLLYGASIPEYEGQARAARRICDALVAQGATTQHACDSAYDQAIAAGRAANSR